MKVVGGRGPPPEPHPPSFLFSLPPSRCSVQPTVGFGSLLSADAIRHVNGVRLSGRV